jgi:hypothetical protein
MHVLNLTLQPPTSITHAVIGGFSGTHKQQEIAVCRGGTRVEILKLDESTQRLDTLYSSEAFAGIRSMVPFRLTGQGKGKSTSCTWRIIWQDGRASYALTFTQITSLSDLIPGTWRLSSSILLLLHDSKYCTKSHTGRVEQGEWFQGNGWVLTQEAEVLCLERKSSTVFPSRIGRSDSFGYLLQ